MASRMIVAALAVLSLTHSVAHAEVRCAKVKPAGETAVSTGGVVTLSRKKAYCPAGSRYGYILQSVRVASNGSAEGLVLRRISRKAFRTGKGTALRYSFGKADIGTESLYFQTKTGSGAQFRLLPTSISTVSTLRCATPGNTILGSAYTLNTGDSFCDTRSEYAYLLESFTVSEGGAWQAVLRMVASDRPIPKGYVPGYDFLGYRFTLSSSSSSTSAGFVKLIGMSMAEKALSIVAEEIPQFAVPTRHTGEAMACATVVSCYLLPTGGTRDFGDACAAAESGLAVGC